LIIQGKSRYAKLKNPVPTFDKSDKEWAFDLTVDEVTAKKLAEAGCAGQIKTNKAGERIIKFSRRVTKKDPTNENGPRIPSKPFEVVGRDHTPWDGRLIGNDSILNVMVAVNPKFGGGNKANAIKIQVWELVEYEGSGDFEEFPKDEAGTETWA
jgi:hypothetical protein